LSEIFAVLKLTDNRTINLSVLHDRCNLYPNTQALVFWESSPLLQYQSQILVYSCFSWQICVRHVCFLHESMNCRLLQWYYLQILLRWIVFPWYLSYPWLGWFWIVCQMFFCQVVCANHMLSWSCRCVLYKLRNNNAMHCYLVFSYISAPQSIVALLLWNRRMAFLVWFVYHHQYTRTVSQPDTKYQIRNDSDCILLRNLIGFVML